MFLKRLACAALAALAVFAAPASAASFLGDAVVIRRFHGVTPVFDPVAATVGAGFEYEDNFFEIDITANEVVFTAAGGNFSISDVRYQIAGLDFDDEPTTPNVIEGFAWSQINGTQANPFGPSRATIGSDGLLRVSFANTTGGAGGIARLTFGPPIASPVPEPATWAMMIVGFGLVGGSMRSARRQRPGCLLKPERHFVHEAGVVALGEPFGLGGDRAQEVA